MSKLSKHEQYLFSLTDSVATTVTAQRNAIARAGLVNKSKNDLRKETLAKFKIFKNKPLNKNIPLYVLRKRFNESSFYKLENAGKKVTCNEIRSIAFQSANWGKLRKRNYGESSLYAGIRTETNGKSGWKCVSYHYADYVLIKSSDNKKIFIQFNGTSVEKTLFNNKFILNGKVYTLDKNKQLFINTARIQCKILKKAGFQAKVVRQTEDLVAFGSDKSSKTGQLYCIVKWNNVSWYHCDNKHFISVRELKAKFDKFIKVENEKQLNNKCMLLIKNQPEKIWVSKEDSLQAGNCLPGTELFEKIVNRELKTNFVIGAVRADILLSIRNDGFVLKAVQYAARRIA